MITAPADVRDYLDAVRARLDDLPVEEREDLLADVEPSVVESAQDADAPVAQRLGPPERFADDLRAAAGLAPRTDPAMQATAPRPSLRELAARVTVPPWLRELAPLWWVARAVVALGILAEATSSFDGQGYLPGDASWFVAPPLILASLYLGLRPPPWPRLITAVNVICAVAAIPIASGIAHNLFGVGLSI